MEFQEDILTIAFRLVLAAALGGIIGFERERENKPAGLRTHILVSIGCCLFMLVSGYAPRIFESALSDPTRIAAQIVTGIGFLGAGSIIRARGAVYGLTTAASIWTVAAIGMAVGSGFYSGALIGTLLAWIVLSILDRWELQGVLHKGKVVTLSMKLGHKDLISEVQEFIERQDVKVWESRVRKMNGDWTATYRGTFPVETIKKTYDHFAGTEGVSEISFGEGHDASGQRHPFE